jgi:succinate dehydrogenase / fumarate reductase, cytochrome b subunit
MYSAGEDRAWRHLPGVGTGLAFSCRDRVIETKKRTMHGGCQCGGNCHSRQSAALTPNQLLALDFSSESTGCQCSKTGRVCSRRYLAATGFLLAFFLVSHLAVNALGMRPALMQSAVNGIHNLGIALPVLEALLIFFPLLIHVSLGVRTLWREKLTYGVEKHHHGSDLRQWLQRLTALILLVFLAFHVATLSRWGLHLVYGATNWQALDHYAAGGLFVPARAFESIHAAVGRFWSDSSGHAGNLLTVQFYLLGIAAAVYHAANGVATGAEVLDWTTTPAAQKKFWRICFWSGLGLGGLGLAAWYSAGLA